MTVTEKNDWMKLLAGTVLGGALSMSGWALVKLSDHGEKITKNTADIAALQEADRLIRADSARTHDETRQVLAEIQADIKKLLAERRSK